VTAAQILALVGGAALCLAYALAVRRVLDPAGRGYLALVALGAALIVAGHLLGAAEVPLAVLAVALVLTVAVSLASGRRR